MIQSRVIPLSLVGAAGPAAGPSEDAWFHDPADWHRFNAEGREYLFVTAGSRVFEIDGPGFDELAATAPAGAAAAVPRAFGVPTAFPPPTVERPPLTAVSLAVAQRCNLGCTYCYASEGDFGQASQLMPLDTALRSVERLFRDRGGRRRVNVAFMGGEPLLNRAVVQQATRRASELGSQHGVDVGFSITSNGTLMTPDDAQFFEEHGFAVTISMDGPKALHDRQRPLKSGLGSYDRIVARVQPLLTLQRKMQVSARVSVTPENLDLKESLDHLIGLGFHSVGFSPVLTSPTGRGEVTAKHLAAMLDAMIECGEAFERHAIDGRRYAFSNMTTAMREIHSGSARVHPCGAGAEYVGINAEGAVFACHRFVNDASGAMGDIADGIDPDRQAAWLQARSVDRQQPCGSCWARYLCGGGCHHEVLHRGRIACDYIRGWLDYALRAYARLLAARPHYFGADQ